MIAPPLAEVTGTVEPGEVYGSFGPVDAFTWRGACVGGCGARPGTRPDGPRPECSGCGRARTGARGGDGAIGAILPVPARVLPGELGTVAGHIEPVNAPANAPVAILRPSRDVDPTDASLPSAVRGLLRLAAEHHPRARVTAAVAHDEAGPVVSLAVRVPGVGYALYVRRAGGWTTRGAMLVTPHVRRAGVTEFAAVLAGVDYTPPPPREPIRGCCVQCRAEVSITAAGAIYASHKCKARTVEGRS